MAATTRRDYLALMGPGLHLAPDPDEILAPEAASVSVAVSAPISVVLADDHVPMRRSLRLLLDGEPDLEVVAEAGDHTAAAREVHGHHPKVLVLDLRMGGRSSLEAVRTLSERVPQTRIVVISMEDNPVFAQRALTAGALGFVAKDLADVELPQAVRAAAADHEFVSPRVAARLDALHRALTDHKLTQREVEVLRLIAFGHTSVEIARKLQLSPRTIETHRAHIHKKLELSTRAELVRYALRRGLIGA
jgi:two-component system, NarL family, response regulator NreC